MSTTPFVGADRSSSRESEDSPFHIERRADRVAVLWLDRPGRSVNTLDPSLSEPLSEALDEIERDPRLDAVVLASGKEESFVVGADVEMLRDVESSEEGSELARRAQAMTNRLEAFPKPLVAAVDGDCVGGGLEIVLTCDECIASDREKTRLGLPEVRLGVLPGAGGTQRLPERVGVEQALELILTGRRIPAHRALEIGLVDEVVHPAILIEAAAERARGLADRAAEKGSGSSTSSHERGARRDLKDLLLEENPFGRRLLLSQAEKRVKARTGDNLPAPLEALSAVRAGIENGMEVGLRLEAEAFGRLLVSPESRALVDHFLWRQELSKERGVETSEGVEPSVVDKVAVVGAGLMGGGIARVTAEEAELPVRLRDVDHEPLLSGLRRLRRGLDREVGKGRLGEREAKRVLSRIRPTTGSTGFARADVVVEAVLEDLEVKRGVLREMEGLTGEKTVFATNTSSLPIARLADAAERPERVVGMHYFSPVEKVPLLEVVRGAQTADEVVATCVELGKRQGKTVIVVRDGAGFYTTRILAPYLDEAVRLLGEGAPIDEIDEALEGFGFPVGPLRLLDEVGIDVGNEIAEILHDAFGDRMEPAPVHRVIAEDDRSGRKNGRGLYCYRRRGDRWERTGDVDDDIYALLGVEPREGRVPGPAIVERCVLRMANEAVRCLDEGIVRSVRDAEVGAVFGLGFPPFLGGPLRWIDRRGADRVVADLVQLASECGPRFAPADRLVSMAKADEAFLPAREEGSS